jgi:membrane fusion protein (multidrug efflux system)
MEATTSQQTQQADPPPSKRRINRKLLLAIAFLLIVAGLLYYRHAQQFEETDDAQVDGHINPVAARVDGTIHAVHADDNQEVEAGQLLVELDPRDNQVAFNQAKAEVDQAVAQLRATNSNLPITQITNRTDLQSKRAQVASADAALAAAESDLESAKAKLKEAEAVNERDQADFERFQILYDKKEVAKADYERHRATSLAQAQTVAASKAAAASAQKTVEQRAAQMNEAQQTLSQSAETAPLQVSIRNADIKGRTASGEAAQAGLEKAKLNLIYDKISAPVSGVVTQRSAEIGTRITAGQQLLMIVQTDDLWVTANFKETQLARMRPGQSVRVHVDALKQDFSGHIESLPAITGSRASVLPPENATGNYVKVVQRMPVRIRLERNQNNLDKLRPGMSVEPEVHLD